MRYFKNAYIEGEVFQTGDKIWPVMKHVLYFYRTYLLFWNEAQSGGQTASKASMHWLHPGGGTEKRGSRKTWKVFFTFLKGRWEIQASSIERFTIVKCGDVFFI